MTAHNTNDVDFYFSYLAYKNVNKTILFKNKQRIKILAVDMKVKQNGAICNCHNKIM